MFRASTPTHTFIFPSEVNPTNCTKIQITYAQPTGKGRCPEKIILVKNKPDTTISGQRVSVDFTQEEMNKFSEGIAEIQIRAKNDFDKVMPTQILKVKVKKVLNQEIL